MPTRSRSFETTIAPAFTAEAIHARIGELAQEIRRDAADGEILLIGILKGTAVFMADLLRAIEGPVTYDFIDVVREPVDAGPADALGIDFFAHVEIRDRDVYLLKDVVTTGVIENYLVTQLRARAPRSIKIVALLDREEERTVEVVIDYRVFVAPRAIYVGYGLEQDGKYGNLPYIGKVSS